MRRLLSHPSSGTPEQSPRSPQQFALAGPTLSGRGLEVRAAAALRGPPTGSSKMPQIVRVSREADTLSAMARVPLRLRAIVAPAGARDARGDRGRRPDTQPARS